MAESLAITTRPVGPSARHYANAAAIVETRIDPPALLAHLKAIERAFGRRQVGQPWQARVLDLDIILWSGGIWASPGLGIPHAQFRARRFVLSPAAQIAPLWRDPLTGRTLRQLARQLDRRRGAP
jgi:2-amino-4-hydroxy-6-hydroxymethyldihydropteridine diphosphokinase